MPKTLVRPAVQADLPTLTQLDRRCWGPHNSPAALAPDRSFGLPLASTWVAVHQGKVAGYVNVGLCSDLASQHHVRRVHSIAVDPSLRRMGIGGLLLDAAKSAARVQGARKLTLRVMGSNPNALALYRKNGFGVEAHMRAEFNVGGEDIDDRTLFFPLNTPEPKWCAGSCHCGAVQFEVFVRTWEVLDCNCSICTKKGILHLIVDRDDVRMLRGEEALSTYTFGTHTAKHHFCRTCGMHPFYVPRSHPDGWDVNARALDNVALSAFVCMPFDGRQWESSVTEIQ